MTIRMACPALEGLKQLPLALGYNFDCIIGHFDGGLIIDRSVGLGNRFAQEVNECVVDACVADARGRKKKFHN